MNQGLSGSWAAFLSSLSAAREALGDAGLRGWLERAADEVRLLVERFTALPSETQTFVGAVLIAGPALLGFSALLRGIWFALGGLLPILRVARVLFATMLGPVGLVVAAIAGAAYLLIRNWEDVVAWFDENMPVVSDLVRGVADGIGPAWETAAERVKEAWESQTDWHALGLRAGQAIADGIRAWERQKSDWGDAIARWLGQIDWSVVAVQMRAAGAQMGEALWDGFIGFFKGLGDFAQGLLEGLLGVDEEWKARAREGQERRNAAFADFLQRGTEMALLPVGPTLADPAAAPAIAASAQPFVPPVATATGSRAGPEIRVDVGGITVEVGESADPRDVAEAVEEGLGGIVEQIRDAFEDHDSDLSR